MQNTCSQCPYCSRIEFVGDNKSKPENNDRFDTVIHYSNAVVITPTRGMIVPGYLLAISRTHIKMFSEFPPSQLVELQSYILKILAALNPLFGEYIFFEHGPQKIVDGHKLGGCIGHAHLHLIPKTKKLVTQIKLALPWQPLKSFSELHEKGDYALFGDASNFYFSSVPNLPSQWIRKQLALSSEGNCDWDWTIDAGVEELEATLATLRDVFPRLRAIG